MNYLKKILLDILPSLAATIIGAYIVHYYIIPAATPKSPATAIIDSNVDAKPAPAKPDIATSDKASFVKGVAEKAAIEKTAEKASEKAGDSAPADLRKHHATPRAAKAAAVAPDQTASTSDTPIVQERRDANDLARAAIQRLRTTAEPTGAAAAPVVMPALPPAVTLASPSPEVFNAGTGAIVAPARPPQTTTPTRSADASRPQPPAEIPVPPPLDLHGDIVTTGRTTTVADDVMSAAKTMFHAVLPR